MIDTLIRRQEEAEERTGAAEGKLVRQRQWSEYLFILGNLAGARASWGMGSVDSVGNAHNLNGQVRVLAKVGGVTFNIENHVVPYANYNGTTGYHTIGDSGIDLLGNEAIIETAIQGLTLVCWYWADAFGSTMGLVHKGDLGSAADSNFLLDISATAIPTFRIYSGGSTESIAGAAISAAGWHCAICRFKTATEVSIDSDGVKTLAASALTSLNDSARALYVGAEYSGGAIGTFLNGRVAVLALVGSWIDDDLTRFLYRYGRALLK